MLTIHHLRIGRSIFTVWLLEELGVEYNLVEYLRHPETMRAPPELKDIHPLGKSPVVVDGDNTIAESGAIVEYLVDRYGDGRMAPPAGSPERLRYTYWLHYAEGSLMPLLVMKLIFDRINNAKMPFFVKPIAKRIVGQVMTSYLAPNIETHMGYVENHLFSHKWFAGDTFSAADVQMIFPLEASVRQKEIAENYPNIKAYVERVHARPAYQRALAAGEPYAFANRS